MLILYKSYKYDNKYDYIKTFSDKTSQDNYFNSLSQLTIVNDPENNYIKDHETFKIAYDEFAPYESFYDYLVYEGVNYIKFNNGNKDVFAFITRKEYLSENTVRINYEIDVTQTYLFDFSIGESFVSRKVCSLNEIGEFDEGITIGEHEIVEDNIVINKDWTYFVVMNGFRSTNLVFSGSDVIDSQFIPVDISSPKTEINGIVYPVNLVPLDNVIGTSIESAILTHPSTVSILGMPTPTYDLEFLLNIPYVRWNSTTQEYETFYDVLPVAKNITKSNVESDTINISKSQFTDFYPYTYYVLSDGETDPLIMKPQYMNSNFTINGKYAMSLEPISRYYPSYYKGDTTGRTYGITNVTQSNLPTATNEGIAQMIASSSSLAQQEKQTWTTAIFNTLTGAVGGGIAGAVGGGLLGGGIPGAIVGGVGGLVTGGISGYNAVTSFDARMEDLQLTPNSIKNIGNPSTRIAFGTDNVRLQKLTIQQHYKDKMNNFVDRYGNKFNNYATIDHLNYSGYLQMVSPDLDTKIDNVFINKLIEILERGVYIE